MSTHIMGMQVRPHKIFVILLRGSGLIYFCKCMVDVRSASREAWKDHAHFKMPAYKKTDEYFFKIPFASSRLWSKILLKIFSSIPPDHPKGRSRATPIFYIENYYKKTEEDFSTIPFASSRLWSKIFLEILLSMVSHLKGRGSSTPIFHQKLLQENG